MRNQIYTLGIFFHKQCVHGWSSQGEQDLYYEFHDKSELVEKMRFPYLNPTPNIDGVNKLENVPRVK